MAATVQKIEQSLTRATAQELGLSQSYLDLVKDVYAKNATDDELALFLRTAHRLGLDPTARQIYLVKRWDSSLKREVATPQVSIDGFRTIADRTDAYVPGREAEFAYDADGKLRSATAFIKKFVGNEWHEISATAYFSEYVQKTKEGKPNSMWQRMPHLMLAKCAESLVLRKAFPAQLSGIYTIEEYPAEPAPRPPTKGQVIQLATNAESVMEGEIIDAIPTEAEHVDEGDRVDYASQVATLLKDLNNAKDQIKWTPTMIRNYAAELFDLDVLNDLKELTAEQYQFLAEDLQQRLDGLR